MKNKKIFVVDIEVKASTSVEVEADTPEQAEEIARRNFGNGDPLIDDSQYEVTCNAIAEVRS